MGTLSRGHAGGGFFEGVFFGAAVVEDGGPFGEAAAEDAAGFLGFVFSRLLRGDGAVVEGHLLPGVVGDAEDEETEVHQDGEDGLAREFHAAAPPTRTAEGTGNLAVHRHPVLPHGFVPEPLHAPGEDPHVGRTAHGKAVAPEDVFRRGVRHGADADFGVGNGACALGDEFGHAGDVAGFGIEEDEDLVHGAGGERKRKSESRDLDCYEGGRGMGRRVVSLVTSSATERGVGDGGF